MWFQPNPVYATFLLMFALMLIPIAIALSLVAGEGVKQWVAKWAATTDNKLVRKISF